MSLILRERPGEHSFGSDRLLIFLFFLVGAFASFFGSFSLPENLPPRLLYGALLGAVLLLSASCLGFLMLPLCALLFGAFLEQDAMLWLLAWQERQTADFKVLICSAILAPVFFLAAVHGLTVSNSLTEAVRRGSPTLRDRIRIETVCVLLLALMGCAAIFYFY